MPIKYVPFIPEPVEGQAVLSNFNRILKYKGADDISMSIQRGMPLYEMEKLETVGENNDGNMVIRGECVSACAYLKEQGIKYFTKNINLSYSLGKLRWRPFIKGPAQIVTSPGNYNKELLIIEKKADEKFELNTKI